MSWARMLGARIRAQWKGLGPQRRRWTVVALAAGLLLAGVFLVLSTRWTLSTIGDAATESSMAVDASGGVHVAYWDPASTSPYRDSVMYASKGVAGWSLTQVDALMPNDQMVDPTSIAVAADGHAWVAYSYWVGVNNVYSVNDTVLNVATDDSGAWVVMELPGHGVAPSVAVGPAGQVYVAFISVTGPQSGGNLTVLRQTASGWSGSILAEVSYDPRPYTQVAVDRSGHVHVAFGNMYELGYGTNETGSWAIAWLNETTSDGVPTWVTGPSMALDPEGHAHLSFQGQVPGTNATGILYMTNAGGVWMTYPLDYPGVLVETAIAVDSRGTAHVAWYDPESNALKYAMGSEAVWSTQIVGPAFGGMVPLSIGVAPSGQVHLVYHAMKGFGYATDRVDWSNLGDFLGATFVWWVLPVLVCAVAVVQVAFHRERPRAA